MDGEFSSGVEAQQSVIGSMLIDSRCVGPVLAALREDDFTDPTCRNTFVAIRDLFVDGGKVDPVLVQGRVGGGSTWVSWARQVMEITPTAANVLAYCEIVKDHRALKQFRDLCRDGLEARTAEDGRKLAREIAGVFSEVRRMEQMSAMEMATDFLNRMKAERKPEYLPWGLPSADGAVFAELGDMILLGGYASAGKTLLSVQMALSQARRYKVVYYTLETQLEKMGDRIFSHLTPLSLSDIKTRKIANDDWARIATACSKFCSETPIDFVHASHATVDGIAADAVARGAQIIYIDYVQLVYAKTEGLEGYQKVTEVSRELKLFAQAHKIAVVALAQLSRPDKLKSGGVVPPSMHSFKESGQLEQDADAAFLLWRHDDNDNFGPRDFKLAKNKEGRKFVTVLKFDGATQTMTDLQMTPEEYEESRRHPASVAGKFAADGRAIKRANHARAMQQVQFSEFTGDDDENPF